MIKRASKKRFMIVLYALYITFILLTMSSFIAEDYVKLEMKDQYEYHLTYKSDGVQSHYYVERVNNSLEGKIDLTYTTATHTLEVDVKNIKVLHIDCKSMYNDESMKVFGIDPNEYPNYYKKYFIDRDLFNVVVDTNTQINNLTFKYTPIPVKVIVNGHEWWKTGINYSYNGEDIVFTLVPVGHTDIEIHFKEGPKLKPPSAAFTYKIWCGKIIKFDATASKDPGGNIVHYLWDFGDYAFGSGPVIAHNYKNSANYTVILTVRDNDGYKDTEIKIIPLAAPQKLKLYTIANLEAAKTGDIEIDEKLDEAIGNINNSLENKFWINETHLDPGDGLNVFDKEKEAVKGLQELIKDKTVPESVKNACRKALINLVTADKTLADTAFLDATVYEGQANEIDKEIESSEKELVKADKKFGKEKYDKAIDNYRDAWEHAQKAIELATK